MSSYMENARASPPLSVYRSSSLGNARAARARLYLLHANGLKLNDLSPCFYADLGELGRHHDVMEWSRSPVVLRRTTYSVEHVFTKR